MLPDGQGPFPTVLLFHGRGGQTPALEDYAAALATHGVASVNIDSLAPRAWSEIRAKVTVCTGLALPGHRSAGARFETWFPENATHDFDVDHGGLPTFRYDPALAAEARARVTRFLGDHL